MNRTFGVEIEARGIAIANVATVLQEAGIQAVYEGYNHAARSHWKVVTDASLGAGGFEVVSPVLSGEEGLAQVRTVLDALRRARARVDKSCGLHVHIGAADFSVNEFRNIAKNYVVFEDFFDAIMPLSRRGTNNMWTRSNRSIFGPGYDNAAAQRGVDRLNAIQGRNARNEIISMMHGGCQACLMGRPHRCDRRYYKLNLTAFFQHGTIEFRQHSGTVEADKAVNWIRLLIQFVNRAAVTRQRPNIAPVSLPTVFQQFFRSMKIDAAGADLRPYFTERRKGFHGE